MHVRFDSCLRRSIYLLPASTDIGAVGFISVHFALFVCSPIHLCAFRFMFVPVRLNFCAVRLIFGLFDLFLRGLIHFLLF